jgi:GT2 family glycosyltransferase
VTDRPSVSLLLPNMNNEPVLDEFMEKLATNTTYPNVELVVVDDGSSDGSQEILRRWRDRGRFERFRLVEQENAGVPVTLNRAIGISDGELLVRLDGDATIETPGWLERMLALRAVDDRVGMVVGSIEFADGRVHALGREVVLREGLHDRGTVVLERRERTLDSLVHRPQLADVAFRDRAAEVDSALGCCTLFTRETAEAIGGIDERYSPVWIEDDDFGLAVRAHGQKVFVLPEIRIVHHVGRRNARIAPAPGTKAPGYVETGIRTYGLRAYNALPAAGKRPFARRLSRWAEAPSRLTLLRRHYDTWAQKWGFDPLNPDLDAVHARWGGSEVWWREDPERRQAGEDILRRYRETA